MRISLFVFLSIFSVLLQASNKSFDYWQDGVYDAYTEIENSLRRGLKEDKLKDLKNKWLIIQDISKDSTVQLIFYRTVAYKNNFLEAVTVKNNINGKNYVIYGSYNRKADAVYASKRLSEKGIEADTVYSGDNVSYSNNPIIIKKLIMDMKLLLEDTPVIVVKETEILNKDSSKDLPRKQVKCKKTVCPKISKNEILNNNVLHNFFSLEAKFKLRGKIDTDDETVIFEERSGIKNHYKKKDFFKGFKITEIYKNSQTGFAVVKIMGDNGKTYKLYEKISDSSKPKSKKSAVKAVKKEEEKKLGYVSNSKAKTDVKKKNIAVNTTDNTDVYRCDFSKISIAKDKAGNKISVSKTHYADKQLDVRITKGEKEYKIQYSGYETIFIQPYYFKNCSKR